MTNNLKKTPLNAWHRNTGANMADFGGFDMPLWYDTGVKTSILPCLRPRECLIHPTWTVSGCKARTPLPCLISVSQDRSMASLWADVFTARF